MVRGRVVQATLAAAAAAASTMIVSVVFAAPAQALAPVNPVRVDLAGHPANSGFLVFVEGNVALNADESEGTVAAGKNLSFNSTYNVAAHSPADSTFTAPGDARPTYLYVGGGMRWAGAAVLRVLNGGFTKIGDATTFTAHNQDNNGATVNYRITRPGANYASLPAIEGTTTLQSAASVATPVPASLIDIGGAFTRYRELTTEIAGCPANATLTDPDGGPASVPTPYPPGTRGRLTLTAGRTNVLQMSTQDLANLSEITFTNQPTASTPLVVNVTGSAFDGTIPNLAGISDAQAPFILWNFPQARSIVVTGGAAIEGTIYAPNAALNWRPGQNVAGNVVAAAFTHGPATLSATPRELHDFPFATTVSCEPVAPTATLTLVKHVDNTGGGTATPGQWTLTADGPTTVTGPGNSPEVTNVTVPAGDYQLRETGGVPDYVPGAWSCTGGTLTQRTVSVAANADVTCEITNTFRPPPPTNGTLTLVKNVENDDGGLATPDQWTLTAQGPVTISGPGNSPAVTGATVAAGDYVLSESDGPRDYVDAGWSCTGGTLDGSTVTVAADADVRCEITNTYSPPPPIPAGTITLVKDVDNTGGGSATPDQWTLTATGPEVVTGPGNSPSVTAVVVDVGDYRLSEADGPTGYTAGTWTCTGGPVDGATVTVAVNAFVTCRITNTWRSTPTSSPPPSSGSTSGGGGSSGTGSGSAGVSGVVTTSGAGGSSDGGSSSNGGTAIAATGADIGPTALVGVGLVALGGLLLLRTRRRRSH